MLTQLILRLEAATMPRLDLDRDIFFVAVPAIKECWPHFTDKEQRDICPRYTESVDIALGLVPEPTVTGDHGKVIECRFDYARAPAGHWATVNHDHHGRGATPAIALAIAALKAREAANAKR